MNDAPSKAAQGQFTPARHLVVTRKAENGILSIDTSANLEGRFVTETLLEAVESFARHRYAIIPNLVSAHSVEETRDYLRAVVKSVCLQNGREPGRELLNLVSECPDPLDMLDVTWARDKELARWLRREVILAAAPGCSKAIAESKEARRRQAEVGCAADWSARYCMLSISFPNGELVKDGLTPWHQDTDEPNMTLTWVPLSDVDARSGCLIGMSNPTKAKLPSIPCTEPGIALLTTSEDALRPDLIQALPCAAGDAVFMDAMTPHATAANLGPRTRWAIIAWGAFVSG